MILANLGFTLIHEKTNCMSFIDHLLIQKCFFLFWLGLASDVLYN